MLVKSQIIIYNNFARLSIFSSGFSKNFFEECPLLNSNTVLYHSFCAFEGI